MYYSHLTTWRAQRERGELAGLTPEPRGPAPKPQNPLAAKVAALEREVSREKARANRAEALVELQKKSGRAPGDPPPAERRESLMAVIMEDSPTLGVASVCRALAVPRASYYRWQHSPVQEESPTPARRGAVCALRAGSRRGPWPAAPEKAAMARSLPPDYGGLRLIAHQTSL